MHSPLPKHSNAARPLCAKHYPWSQTQPCPHQLPAQAGSSSLQGARQRHPASSRHPAPWEQRSPAGRHLVGLVLPHTSTRAVQRSCFSAKCFWVNRKEFARTGICGAAKHRVLCVADERSPSEPKPRLLRTPLSHTEKSNCFLTEALGNGRESGLSGGREGWDIPTAPENGTWSNCTLPLGLEVGLTSRGRNLKCKQHLQGKAEGSGSCSAHFSP